MLREYRGQMRTAAELSTLDAWYDHLDVDQIMDWIQGEVSAKRLGKQEAKEAAEDVAKARARDHLRVFRKRAGEIEGELRIVADPPLIVPIEDLAAPGTTREEIDRSMRKLIQSYRRTLARHHHPIEEFEYVHAARKVVGVGSVGTQAMILLMVGRDDRDVAVPAGEGGTGLRARAVRRRQRARQPRPAGRGRPAADAGGQRHLPRLDPRQGPRRPQPRLLHPPAARLEGRRRGRDLPRARGDGSTGASAARPSRARTRAGATGWRSRRTSARATSSTARSRTSPWRTQIRTSATTRPSRRPSSQAGSPRRQVCSGAASEEGPLQRAFLSRDASCCSLLSA